jgi:hypothetical protein
VNVLPGLEDWVRRQDELEERKRNPLPIVVSELQKRGLKADRSRHSNYLGRSSIDDRVRLCREEVGLFVNVGAKKTAVYRSTESEILEAVLLPTAEVETIISTVEQMVA